MFTYVSHLVGFSKTTSWLIFYRLEFFTLSNCPTEAFSIETGDPGFFFQNENRGQEFFYFKNRAEILLDFVLKKESNRAAQNWGDNEFFFLD